MKCLKLADGAQMKAIDAAAIESCGIPGAILMEHAALALLDEARQMLCRQTRGRRVCILCGKGNNGGDGFALARLLLLEGADVTILLACREEEITGDARLFYNMVHKMGGAAWFSADAPEAAQAVRRADLLVDALFGIGFRGEMDNTCAQIVRQFNETDAPILAVDIPSGLEAGRQTLPESCIRADVTVIFTMPKMATLLYPAAHACGRVVVADIGIPPQAIAAVGTLPEVITEETVRSALPIPAEDTNKSDFGKLEIVAGSTGLTGAAYLCATGALVAGCGLITLNTPACVCDIMEAKLTEVMKHPLPCEDGMLSPESVGEILLRASYADAVLYGPGLGRGGAQEQVLAELLQNLHCPLVIDADGLYALQNQNELLHRAHGEVVITPHAMEMSRLCGKSPEEVAENAIFIAKSYSMEYHVVVVLKGARTVVALPDGRVFVNTTGSNALSTGGTGDVLAGLVAAFLAQGIPAGDAACAAVYLHGLAADIGAPETSRRAFTAQRLLEYLPRAILQALGQ